MRTLTISCDLCGSGAYAAPEDFTRISGVDLCRHCAADDPTPRRLECGPHDITFTGSTWSCTCGTTSRQLLDAARVARPGRVLDAVPNLPLTLARIHGEDL